MQPRLLRLWTDRLASHPVRLGLAATAALVALAAAFVLAGVALSPVTGAYPLDVSIAERARAAASNAVPDGTADRVTHETGERIAGTPAAYGVIVRRPDGTTLEVHLDRDYRVLGANAPDPDSADDH